MYIFWSNNPLNPIDKLSGNNIQADWYTITYISRYKSIVVDMLSQCSAYLLQTNDVPIVSVDFIAWHVVDIIFSDCCKALF